MAAAAGQVGVWTQAPRDARGVPWYIWTGVAAVTSASIGGAWDVSWHRTIGRDTFWTPAHMLIYACGVLAGIVGLWLILHASLGRDTSANRELRANSVSVLGLRAPLGVFLAGWGGVAMLTSAPFDNWWHNAYGLDVKIISPPHALLVLGIRGVGFGMLFLILAAMNRAQATGAASYLPLRRLFLYIGGLSVVGQMFFIQEQTWDVVLHRAAAYIALGIGVPMILSLYWEASQYKWTGTVICAIYMAFLLAEIWILPLFPAQPKLGPVFNPVTHMVPGKFPILLIVPALALDLLWQRIRAWKPWQISIVSGVVFTVVMVAVQWPFADFLMSHASQNRFFGTIYFDYNSSPLGVDRLREFLWPQHGAVLLKGLAVAALCAMASTWVGLRFGRWMRGVQR
jgi:hypothetical protein